jgi:branched-chain amino acid transport system ATP-binding protein
VLDVQHLRVAYGPTEVLRDVTFSVPEKSIVALLGGNGSGKTTLLNALTGVVRPKDGSIRLDGSECAGKRPDEIVRIGIAQVPQGRDVWSTMSVAENLELGAVTRRDKAEAQHDLDEVFQLFPRLAEKRKKRAGALSGGEQQMVAMGRALMSRPKLLLMDEPSMGLAPILVEQNFDIIKDVHESGVAILVVEQNANVSLSIADRGYVLQTGRIVLSGPASDLIEHEELRRAYLGR